MKTKVISILVLVVKLSHIKKIDLALNVYHDFSTEDEKHFSIEFNDSNSFMGKGQVIEVHILN